MLEQKRAIRTIWILRYTLSMKRMAIISLVVIMFLLASIRTVSNYYPTIVSVTREPNKIVKSKPKAESLSKIAQTKKIGLPLAKPVIKIYKSKRELELLNGGSIIKKYNISLGFSPDGDKRKEGDGKTPEGTFYISQKAKNPDKAYLGTRWMRLSYPGEKHAGIGLKSGNIDDRTYRQIVADLKNIQTPPQTTPLGGGIGIHGGTDRIFGGVGIDWTAGCIGLYDSDAEEIYDQVKVGTGVIIMK